MFGKHSVHIESTLRQHSAQIQPKRNQHLNGQLNYFQDCTDAKAAIDHLAIVHLAHIYLTFSPYLSYIKPMFIPHLVHILPVLTQCSAHIYPTMFSSSSAHIWPVFSDWQLNIGLTLS